MSSTPKTYMSNGQVLDSPPFWVRINRFIDNVYLFLGLYFVSLFSFDAYTAAQNSKFNINRFENHPNTRPRWGGSGGSGSGGSGGGGPGGGFGPRRIGRVDDIRGPECKSFFVVRIYKQLLRRPCDSKMSIPRDDAEWAALISTVKDSLPETFPEYKTPLPSEVNRTIDHTQLALTATEQQIDQLCAEALKYQFATVCVRLNHVRRAVQELKGSSEVKVACVVGFHEGMYETSEKEQEARDAVEQGASELDMVLKYPLLKEGKYTDVYKDILGVRKAAPLPTKLKVILETSQLTREEIIAGSVITDLAGADFIKTSTGFNGPGANVDNVALMRATAGVVGNGCKVKASGGVRSAEDCIRMLKTGAERIGASSGVKIMQELGGEATSERGAQPKICYPMQILNSWSNSPSFLLQTTFLPPRTQPRMRRPNFKKRKTSCDHGQSEHYIHSDNVFTSKPTATFTPTGGRPHTLTVAIPGSIVANAHSMEQKTLLAGIIARALAVFCVDEVVVFDDDENSPHDEYYSQENFYDSPLDKTSDELNGNEPSAKRNTAYSDPSHFLAHILSYLETPPYLRKHLFPMHPNLRGAGLLPSLDMPHHLRANEWCHYREGIVVSSSGRDGQRRNSTQMSNHRYNRRRSSSSPTNFSATVVDTGLSKKVVLPDIRLPEHARVTVRFSEHGPEHYAEPVHPSTPRSEAGYYWGYYVRRCRSLSSVFTECPFDGGYDLSFGTSERGAPVYSVLEEDRQEHDRYDWRRSPPDYKHLLIVFGGIAGIESAIRNDPQLCDMDISPTEAGKLFDYWVNLLPGQGSRTIRTEEAVWLGLTSLRGLVEGSHRPRPSYKSNGL
ncbi:putative RNA methyltransferase-domain-containing protein [Aspergillus alliaceus]|nr:putative RNA methyltransferase-domain-containing protein [Aspergillus alliaceus]KAB8236852.1 putative RNA methyltransferase-domain-containing protein [Aspergillus alliaceus]